MVRVSVLSAPRLSVNPNDTFFKCCLSYSIEITSSEFTADVETSGLVSCGTTIKMATKTGIAPSKSITGFTILDFPTQNQVHFPVFLFS